MWWQALSLAGLCAVATAQLSLSGPRCGELTCPMDQYCSPETSRCAPCNDICDTKHHNYDAGTCIQRCQDYIHELRYVSKTGAAGAGAGGGANADDVRSLRLQVKAALIISSVLLGLVVFTCLFKCYIFTRNNRHKFTWKYLKKKLQMSKGRVKQYPTDLTHHNPHAEAAKPQPKRDLKIEMRGNPEPPPRRNHDSVPRTISTSVSTRHPAEDTTLDYSYDNMALNVTPPPASATVQHF